MSSLSYYKVMTVGKKLSTQIKHAQKTCSQNPKSHDCRVAWLKVEEICATINEVKMNDDKFSPELHWEEESRFYDV